MVNGPGRYLPDTQLRPTRPRAQEHMVPAEGYKQQALQMPLWLLRVEDGRAACPLVLTVNALAVMLP